ncbi:MAG: ABC transporter ATP-binding protein [Rhodospirillaceae bacterium]|nr:ABC transporter ATP-binding protein [Rhodospirillaceae bacterium]|tara:strand:+ start:2062 stop:2778 length:717 start_codon:yes stop_codon:yes gene_type:complete
MLGFLFKGAVSINDISVFKSINLSVKSGEWTCLLGRSGVGKTTILRLVAGLAENVNLDGIIKANDGQGLNGRVALMAQTDNLLPWLDVMENVLLGARLRGEQADRERAFDLIEKVGLADHNNKKPHALSGGERQRVALARTLMEQRPIVLLDEPFSALDARVRAEMQELASDILRGKTILLVTHDPGEAARLGDTILVLDGEGITEVTPPRTPTIRAYDNADVLACQGQLLRLLREQV